jgi:hypothetical protein
MTQEALKLALEALERFEGNKKLWPEAITAIKEALAQTQEPPFSVQQAYAMAQVCLDIHAELGCAWGDNVYLTISRLKASPPQRTWVGLTDDCEIDALHMQIKVQLMGTFDTKDIYRALKPNSRRRTLESHHQHSRNQRLWQDHCSTFDHELPEVLQRY